MSVKFSIYSVEVENTQTCCLNELVSARYYSNYSDAELLFNNMLENYKKQKHQVNVLDDEIIRKINEEFYDEKIKSRIIKKFDNLTTHEWVYLKELFVE
jgi:hypothetical protein